MATSPPDMSYLVCVSNKLSRARQDAMVPVRDFDQGKHSGISMLSSPPGMPLNSVLYCMSFTLHNRPHTGPVKPVSDELDPSMLVIRGRRDSSFVCNMKILQKSLCPNTSKCA